MAEAISGTQVAKLWKLLMTPKRKKQISEQVRSDGNGYSCFAITRISWQHNQSGQCSAQFHTKTGLAG